MRVGMIQSNYLPWRGYFDLIDDVDLFVFYDDVQYTPRSWRNRNRIKTPRGPAWITVPVLHDRTTLVQEARIDHEQRWVAKHTRALSVAYAKAPYFARYAESLFSVLRTEASTLSDLNIALCRWGMEQLGIRTALRRSSEFAVQDEKSLRPLRILESLGATAYLSGPTARAYTDPERFRASGIALEFKSYDYPDYPQLYGAFEPAVTVLDLLFNCGSESRAYLKSRTPNERVA